MSLHGQFSAYSQVIYAAPSSTTSSTSPASLISSSAATTNAANTSGNGRCQLWMGDLELWMDESFLRQAWHLVGESVLVKMIRDRATGGPANYCFIEFPTIRDASRALVAYNGQLIPNTTKPFRLNWASGNNDSKDERGTEYSVFVGDLGHDVNDYMLLTTFQVQYPSVKSAKVVTDATTSLSRGYGFVRFGDEVEQRRAIVEMQGRYCGSRPMRISLATPKTRRDTNSERMLDRDRSGYNPNTDPHNTTVFVGGLAHPISEDELCAVFKSYGNVVYCKIPPNKGCGFVTFERREDSEKAIHSLNGYQIGQSRIRLSWGRSQSHARVFSSASLPSILSYMGYNPPALSNPGAHPGIKAASTFPSSLALASNNPPPPLNTSMFVPAVSDSNQAPGVIGQNSLPSHTTTSSTISQGFGSTFSAHYSQLGSATITSISKPSINASHGLDNSDIWSPLASSTSSRLHRPIFSDNEGAIDRIDWESFNFRLGHYPRSLTTSSSCFASIFDLFSCSILPLSLNYYIFLSFFSRSCL